MLEYILQIECNHMKRWTSAEVYRVQIECLFNVSLDFSMTRLAICRYANENNRNFNIKLKLICLYLIWIKFFVAFVAFCRISELCIFWFIYLFCFRARLIPFVKLFALAHSFVCACLSIGVYFIMRFTLVHCLAQNVFIYLFIWIVWNVCILHFQFLSCFFG